MDLNLKGAKALITGGTKGIGRAIADTFADEGCNVAICARNAEEVDAAVAELSAKGVTAFGQAVDVGDGEAFKAWIDASAEALGGVDCIISNVSGGGAPSNIAASFDAAETGISSASSITIRARHAPPTPAAASLRALRTSSFSGWTISEVVV